MSGLFTDRVLLWVLCRSTGTIALVLLSGSVAMGAVSAGRGGSITWPRFVNQSLHSRLAMLAVIFTVVHVVPVIVGDFTPYGLQHILIPFYGTGRPIWSTLGSVSGDIMAVIMFVSLVRQKLPAKTWRVVKWLAYLSWPAGILHGFGVGSDVKFGWYQAFMLANIALVLTAVVWRLTRRSVEPVEPSRARLLIAGRFGVGAVSFALAIWMITWAQHGPMAPGWSKPVKTVPASQTTNQAR
jgi:sulfoxide reductase heme-binding subunit YedZ